MAGTLLKYLRISKYIRISLGTLLAGLLVSVGGWAQTANRQADKPLVSAKQDFCIHVMSGFPQSDQAVRYQFFRLSHSIARDATPEFRQLLSHYASTRISDTTPVRKVIEGMANPVLRQAAPKLVVAQSAWLIGFAKDCQAQIDGQLAALQAWDKDLKIVDFNTTVDKDALYLRQILVDALYQIGVQKDPKYGPVLKKYAKALVRTRDGIEFTVFNGEVGDIEAAFMGDLDKKLARSNDIVNAEMDRNALADSVALANDLNEATKREEQARQIQTLIKILNGGNTN